jgi:hypothetical protein
MRSFVLLFILVLVVVLAVSLSRSSIPLSIKENFVIIQNQNASRVTEGSIAPLCPPGFSFFTDRDGKSTCCRGRIDHTDGRCFKTDENSTLPHVCTLGAEEKDEFGASIPFCGSMMQSLLAELGGIDCTRDKPYRATADGVGGFCCSAAPSSAMPHKCPQGSKSCVVLPQNRNPFTQTNSCSLERFRSETSCPVGMKRTMLVGSEGQIEGMTVPLCMTTSIPRSGTTPMCIPTPIINELRRHGIYRDKDLRRWIGSCDVYRKVNIDKTETPDRVDKSGF